jgi:gliding motility-associated-like protein
MTQGGTQQYIFMSMSSCGMLSDTLDVLVFEDEQLVIQPDSTITLCAPADTVCLSVSFAAPECIVWTDLDGNELGTGEELCVVPPLGESQYIASVPDLDCVASDTVTIMVSELPPPPLPDTTFKLCVGDTLKYELADYPFPYQWKDINGNVLTSDSSLCEVMTQGGMQEYIFMSMSSCGMLSDTLDVLVFEDEQLVIQPDSTITLCAPADTVCLSVSFAAPECIVWTDLDGNELGTGEELCVVPPLGESQYIASVPDLDCVASDTVTIMVSELPPPPLPDTTFKLCVGDTLKYELADYPFPYQWKDINGNVLASDSSLCEVMTQGGTQQYIFMSMSSCGMLSDTLDVLVFEDEQLVIQPDSTITLCAPADTVCLSVSFAAPECIVWTDLDGNELGTGEELCVVPPLGESQYIASVPDLACITSDTVTIMVSELPPPPLPDTTFKLCVGDTLKYELADYPFPYQWKDINGNILTSDSSLCEVMTQGGMQEYIFMSMSSCGMLSDTLDVLVFEDEQLVIQPDSTITLCAPADTVCLSVSFAAPECIVWTDLEGNELGTGEELCVVPPLGTSQYIARVPGLDCIVSDTATIIVDSIPLPPLPDTTLKVCVGDTIKYDIGEYPYDYQWKDINGVVIAYNEALCVEADGMGKRSFFFMAANACGMVADTLEVLIIGDVQLQISPGLSTVCIPADTICLSTSFNVVECLVWTDIDGNELGIGEELCVLPELDTNLYIVSVPGLACVTPDTAIIIVDTFPAPPAPIPDTLLKVCLGDTIQYDVGNYPFFYVWRLENGEIIAINEPLSVEATTLGEQIYIFSSTNECGEVADTLSVEVFDSEKLEIRPEDFIELCGAADTTICFEVDFIAPECLVWTDIDGNEMGTGNELCVQPPIGESQYIVSVPGLDCIEPDTAIIIIDTISPPPPFEDLVINVCAGDTAKYIIEDYPYDFEWLDEDGNSLPFGDTICVVMEEVDSTRITFNATNVCGTVSADLVIIAYDSLKLEIEPDDTITYLCEVPDTTICLEVINEDLADEVVWTDLDGNPVDSGAVLCVMPVVGENTYIATIPGLDCIESDTAVIIVIPNDIDVTLTPTDAIICEGDEVELIAEVNPDWTLHNIEWFEDSMLIDMGVDTLLAGPPAGTYNYTVIVSNICAADTASTTLTVLPALDINISASLDTICEGETTLLSVSGCDDCTYEWSPAGSLSNSNEATTEASPTVTTTYTVVVSNGSCVDSLSITIVVIPEEQCACPEAYFVPTGFTPDNDGTNDFACLRSEFLSSYDRILFMVYNRWGEEMTRIEWVRQSPDDAPGALDFCWDGYHNGKLLPPDVYGFYLELECPDGRVIEDQGNITLLR